MALRRAAQVAFTLVPIIATGFYVTSGSPTARTAFATYSPEIAKLTAPLECIESCLPPASSNFPVFLEDPLARSELDANFHNPSSSAIPKPQKFTEALPQHLTYPIESSFDISLPAAAMVTSAMASVINTACDTHQVMSLTGNLFLILLSAIAYGSQYLPNFPELGYKSFGYLEVLPMFLVTLAYILHVQRKNEENIRLMRHVCEAKVADYHAKLDDQTSQTQRVKGYLKHTKKARKAEYLALTYSEQENIDLASKLSTSQAAAEKLRAETSTVKSDARRQLKDVQRVHETELRGKDKALHDQQKAIEHTAKNHLESEAEKDQTIKQLCDDVAELAVLRLANSSLQRQIEELSTHNAQTVSTLTEQAGAAERQDAPLKGSLAESEAKVKTIQDAQVAAANESKSVGPEGAATGEFATIYADLINIRDFSARLNGRLGAMLETREPHREQVAEKEEVNLRTEEVVAWNEVARAKAEPCTQEIERKDVQNDQQSEASPPLTPPVTPLHSTSPTVLSLATFPTTGSAPLEPLVVCNSPPPAPTQITGEPTAASSSTWTLSRGAFSANPRGSNESIWASDPPADTLPTQRQNKFTPATSHANGARYSLWSPSPPARVPSNVRKTVVKDTYQSSSQGAGPATGGKNGKPKMSTYDGNRYSPPNRRERQLVFYMHDHRA